MNKCYEGFPKVRFRPDGVDEGSHSSRVRLKIVGVDDPVERASLW